MLYIAVGGGEKTGARGDAARRCDPESERKAWYHQPCPNLVGGKLETITDLFFFGRHKYDQADIVIVKSRPVNGVFVVDDDLGSFEPYVWHAVYKDCLQREQFED
ncbi:MAG: hypothetical protein IPM84_12980 [Anaerolineae bacterium]|nr:hypothetical protein [Anaerolineae bacterium]